MPKQESIFDVLFGAEGYVNRKLDGWSRAKSKMAKQRLEQGAQLVFPAGFGHTGAGVSDAHGEPEHGHHSPRDAHRGSACAIPKTRSAPAQAHAFSSQGAATCSVDASSAEACDPHIWLGRIPLYSATEPCIQDLVQSFGCVADVSLKVRRAGPDNGSWCYVRFDGDDEQV